MDKKVYIKSSVFYNTGFLTIQKEIREMQNLPSQISANYCSLNIEKINQQVPLKYNK